MVAAQAVANIEEECYTLAVFTMRNKHISSSQDPLTKIRRNRSSQNKDIHETSFRT